jgi:hypothetical protein
MAAPELEHLFTITANTTLTGMIANGPAGTRVIVDASTGTFEGPEPLRTLATYRRDPTDSTNVNFGQNLIPETKSATLRVGDFVTLP